MKTKITIATIIAICSVSLLGYFMYAFSPTQTPEEEKWGEYERALGLEILNTADAICEWMILGQSNREVYVWAACKLADPKERLVHINLATISLDSGGGIEKVQLRNDFQDAPPEIQDRLTYLSGSDIDSLISHTYIRQENPGPPYIVLWGTPLP